MVTSFGGLDQTIGRDVSSTSPHFLKGRRGKELWGRLRVHNGHKLQRLRPHNR